MWLYHATRIVLPFARLYWSPRLEGAVGEIPASGPLLIAANHASFLDPWFLGMPFPRDIRFLMLRGWYYRSRLWHAFFKACGGVPLEPSGEATVEAVDRILAEGQVVCVFPEGRISDDGRIQDLHSGVAMMAARSGAPLLPVGIRGNFESLPKGRWLPRPASITVHVGKPRRFPGAPRRDRPPQAETDRFLEELRQEIRRLVGQADAVAGEPESPGALSGRK